MKPYRAGQAGPYPLLVDEAGRCREIRGGSGVELEYAVGSATDFAMGTGLDAVLCLAVVPKVYTWDGVMKVKMELVIPAVRASGGGGNADLNFYLGREGVGAVWNQESEDIGNFHFGFGNNGTSYITCVTYLVVPKGRYYFWAGYTNGGNCTILGATCMPPFLRVSMA